MSGHTPGPWKASCPDDQCHCRMVWSSDGEAVVAVVNGHHWRERFSDQWPNDEMANANLHLIEAAPDLLTALKVIHATCVQRSEAGERGDWDGLAFEAGVAIAKATGAQP